MTTMYRSRVEIERLPVTGGSAECERCDQLHPDSTRERCRQHARNRGHVVRYVVEHVTIYQPKESAS